MNFELSKETISQGIKTGNTLLLDASTIGDLSQSSNRHYLSEPLFINKSLAKQIKGMLGDYYITGKLTETERGKIQSLALVLSFLEQWLLAERVYLDKNALDSLISKNPNMYPSENFTEISKLFEICKFPPETIREAADNVVDFYEAADDLDNPIFGEMKRHGVIDYDQSLKDEYFPISVGYWGLAETHQLEPYSISS